MSGSLEDGRRLAPCGCVFGGRHACGLPGIAYNHDEYERLSTANDLGARVVPFSDVLVYQDRIARLWKRVEKAEADNERLQERHNEDLKLASRQLACVIRLALGEGVTAEEVDAALAKVAYADLSLSIARDCGVCDDTAWCSREGCWRRDAREWIESASGQRTYLPKRNPQRHALFDCEMCGGNVGVLHEVDSMLRGVCPTCFEGLIAE